MVKAVFGVVAVVAVARPALPLPPPVQVFADYNGCKKHQAVHAKRLRLETETPVTDQFLSRFWPADSPWRPNGELSAPTDKGMHGYECPIPTCLSNFGSRDDLRRHLRLGHSRFEILRALGPADGGVEWVGMYHLVPPFAFPKGAPATPLCPRHDVHKSRCLFCGDVALYAETGPCPPIKYVEEGGAAILVPLRPLPWFCCCCYNACHATKLLLLLLPFYL